MSGWIKIHRKFLDWEWFNKSEAVHLFIYLLLKANHKDASWQGMEVKRGEFISSLGKISSDTGISLQTLRTLLKKLESTNEIEVKSTNKFTTITICKYDSYQDETEDTNKQLTNNQQTTNKQLTTNKNDKNNKNEKNNTFNFYDSMVSFGFEEQLVKDWIQVRKVKKATNTETAFNGFIREVNKNENSPNFILKNCVERNWSGFKSEWLPKEQTAENTFCWR